MAFENSNSATKVSVVSTPGMQYYGVGIKNEQKALSTKYIGTNMGISIHSALNESERTGNNKFNYKSGNIIHLSPKKSKQFAKLVKGVYTSIIEGDRVADVRGIYVKDSYIDVCDGSKYGLKGVTITIYNDIDSESKRPGSFDVFCFTPEKSIKNYNASDGSYDDDMYDIDVELFIDNLNDFARSCTSAVAHSIRREMKYDIDRIVSRQLLIADKLGIHEANYSRNNVAWNSSNGNNVSSASYAAAKAADDAVIDSASVVDDLDSIA